MRRGTASYCPSQVGLLRQVRSSKMTNAAILEASANSLPLENGWLEDDIMTSLLGMAYIF